MSTQAIPGTVVPIGAQISPGGAFGAQGATGPIGPTGVSADAGNLATLGSDNLILVPQSSLWSMRLRSFNAIGNPTFEVDQIHVGAVQTGWASGKTIDRWQVVKNGTSIINAGQNLNPAAPPALLPGTNFLISRSCHRIVLTTQQTSLGATDNIFMSQLVEGTQWRELSSDVHSIQILCRSSVAGLVFATSLRDNAAAYSLVYLCTIPTANVWTLIQLPNIPIWTPSGTFSNQPALAYYLTITLAAGATFIAPATGTWATGNFLGAAGMSNFAAQAVGSTFEVAYVGHEPGALCTTPIDCPFTENLSACKRYFQKSVAYSLLPNDTSAGTYVSGIVPTNVANVMCIPNFEIELAKSPTVTTYNAVNGAAMGAYNVSTATHLTVTAVPATSKRISYLTIQAGGAANNWVGFNYFADTGW